MKGQVIELMDANLDLHMDDVVEQIGNEIESAGYERLITAEDVDKVPKQDDTALIMTNSVCGCAGDIVRPAASYVLHYDVLPDRLVTVSAGQNREATQKAREYFKGYAPSSPPFVLIKDGKIIEMIERHQVEGHNIMNAINQLQTLFNKYCEEK